MKSKTKTELMMELQTAKEQIAALEKAAQIIDSTERKIYENALQASEANYRTLVEKSESAIAILDRHGDILFSNPRGIEIWKDPQIVGKNISDVYPLEYAERYLTAIHHVIDDQVEILDEVESLIAGQSMWFRLSMTPLKNPDNTVTSLLLNAWDITERKIAEEKLSQSEARFRTAFDSMLEGTQIIGFDWRYIYLNAAAEQHNRRPNNSLLGKVYTDAWPGIETTFVYSKIKECMEERISCHMENEFTFPSGEVRWFELSIQPIPEGVFILSIDITERKNAELLLMERESALRKAQQVAHVGSWVWHISTNQLEWSDEMFHIFGIDKETFSGDLARVIDQAIHPEDRAAVEQANRAVARDRHPQPLEYRILHQDGSIRTVWAEAGEMILDDGGTPIKLTGIVQDITERKKVEDALRLSEQRLRDAQTIGRIGSWEFDPAAERFDFSDSMYTLLNRDPALGAFTLAEALNAFHPKDAPQVKEYFEDILKTGKGWEHDARFIRKDDSIVWHHNIGTAIQDEQGRVVKILGVTQDITERKRVEERLRESEEKYRTLLNSTSDGVFVAQDEKFVFSNATLPAMLGYTAEEFENLPFEQIIVPEDLKIWTERFHKRIKGENVIANYQVQFTDKTGTKNIWFELRANRIHYNGQPAVLGIVRDITERRNMESQLMEANQRFTELAENVSDIFWVSEPKTRKNLYVSPAFYKIIGMSKESVAQLPNQFLDMVLPEDQHILMRMRELEDSGFKTDDKYRIRRPDGSIRWLHDKGTPVMDESGNVIRVVGMASDITEEVEAQKRIRESEMRFKQVAETIPEMFWMFDNQHQQMIYVSPAYELIWGRPVQEFYENKDDYVTAIPPEDRSIVFAAIEKQAHGEATEMEYRVVKPDGSIRWVHDRSFPIFDEETGSLLRTAGIVTDITEQKQADDALRLSEERLRLSLTASHQGLYDLNIQTGEAIVNAEYAEMLGYEPKTFVETNESWVARLHPEDREAVYQKFRDYINGLSLEYRMEFRQQKKDGSWKWILSIGKIVEYDADGKPLRMLGTHTDIDARKQAEIELQKRASQLALINDVGKKITGVLDIQGVLELSARLVHEYFGYHHVGLFTMNEDKSELVMRSKAGKYAPLFPDHHKVKIGVGIVGMVGKDGQMILANHVANDPKYINYYPEVIDTVSELGLPIKIAENVIGVVDIQSPLPHAFNSNDIQVLQTLADQVAIALENARLYESVQKELNERIQVEKDRQILIRDLGERVKELTALHQAARLFQNSNASEADTLQRLVDLLPTAWQHSEITAARITVEDREYSTPGFTETPWMQKASFALPGNRNGAIEVAYLKERPAEDEGPFLKEERELLETMAEKLQSAILRETMERDLLKRTSDLATLLEAGRALSETLDPQRIYPMVYRYITGAMPCDFLIISSFDLQTELIHCEYLHSIEGSQDVSDFPPIPLEPPGQGTQSLVLRSGESMLLPDYVSALKTATNSLYFNDNAEIVEPPQDEDEEVTRSAVIVPLKVNGVVTGALQVLSSQLNAHTEDHLHFVEALANHISAALSNAKLFSELEERVRQRTIEVQDLYDNAPAGYHSLDANGKITVINQTELDWLGYTREEVLGRHISNFLTPASLQVFQETFPIFKHRGLLNALELEMCRKDGSTFPILINATAIKDEEGNYLLSRSTVFDNSDRKKAEHALREREETYRALFESANDTIFMISPDGIIISVNPRCYDLLGYTVDEIIGRKSNEFIKETDESLASSAITRILAGERLPVYERSFIRKDGSLVNTEVNLSIIHDAAGHPKFIQSVVRDISARKQAERALRESEEQNRLLFEESPVAVILFDPGGRVVRMNHAFETLTGLNREHFTGRLITEIGILSQDLMNSPALLSTNDFVHYNELAEFEFKFKNPHGELRDIHTRIFPVNLHGQPHYLASLHDITTSKRAEETLRLANAEMERALRLKDEFLANMSHELRTPLNAILGISESLLEQISGPLNPKQQKYLQTVLESAQHLLELINDILDLAKINAGRIELDINKADINMVANTSLRMIRELAQKKELSVALEIDPAVKYAWLDERRLKQILVNLLSNAVKFTAKGGRIGLEIRSDQNNKNLRFTIWDTGIGIDAKDLHMLFKPFVQLDAGLARGSQGTGLGLALVHQMALLHGGDISVESEPGKGSRFTITLPWVNTTLSDLKAHQTPAIIPQETTQPAPVHKEHPVILIVEDTEEVIVLVSEYLEHHGCQVVKARNGFEGIARAKEKTPDLILMDVMMPELDGLETTRRLRSDLGLVNVPIIALTALAMVGDRENCLAAGMNDYVSKPVKLKDLLTTIERYLKLA